MSPLRLSFAGLAAAAVLFAACSSDTSELAEAETTTTTTTIAGETAVAGETTVAPAVESSSSTTEIEVVTTVQLVPAQELTSEGTITIGAIDYGFAFECYAAGAGDILALGIGSDPETGEETQAIVQAFLGQAYVAVLQGSDRVQELAVDQPAELFVQGEAIRGSALRFVDSAGIPGVGEELGLGAVSVDCNGFAPGLPKGYDLS